MILDSSVIVTAERRGQSVPRILAQLRETWGETEIGISVVTIVELTHGIQRAKLEAQRQRRTTFVEEMIPHLVVKQI